MFAAARDELSAATRRQTAIYRISYAEQRKRPVKGPGGCSGFDAVRDEVPAGAARRISYAEQRKGPVEGPKECPVFYVVRDELPAGVAAKLQFIMLVGNVAGATFFV